MTPSTATTRLLLGAAVLVVALVPSGLGSAASGVLYVDRANPSCSDAGAGSPDQPFCTIGAAAAKVAAGQTVQVAAGTYPEAVTMVTSGTSTEPISFVTAPGATVTVNGQTSGFVISGKSWIALTGFHVTNTTSYGIRVLNSAHITLEQNRVSFSGTPVDGGTRAGIRLENVTDSVVAGNTVDHNTDFGIALINGSTRNDVRNNHVFENARGWVRAASGIRLTSAPGNTVRGNITHDNEDSGIEAYSQSNDTLFSNNVTYDNGDHGIDNNNVTGQRVVANTVYRNVTAGINVEGGSTGATLRNNISVDNGINSPRTRSNIRVDSTSTSGTTMDDDLVDLTTANQVLLIWNSTSYFSLGSFQAATNQETRGIQADPKWKNASAGDFHLLASSPAIDSANSGASGQPAIDADGNARVDDPGTPNTGIGPRSYDDRGAFEFQPGSPSGPVAALTVSPSSGTAPLTVTADASASTGSGENPIASYTFDFGDGTSQVGPQPNATATHTYTAPGRFVATVTVADTAGQTSTASAAVEVASAEDAPPVAALTVTPSSGSAPLTVTANASASTDTDATPIASYTFDFGDGSPAVGPQAGATATHVYPGAGTFTVTVTVTDTAGLSSTANVMVTVADSPPTAVLTVTPANGRRPLSVIADASKSTDADATPIATYSFDFGDGSPVIGPQTGATAAHTYTAVGTFTVTVTVTDTAGFSSTAQKKVKVR